MQAPVTLKVITAIRYEISAEEYAALDPIFSVTPAELLKQNKKAELAKKNEADKSFTSPAAKSQ